MNTVAAPLSARARYLRTLPVASDGEHPLRVTPDGAVAGRFLRCSLSSVFQPVMRLDGSGTVGHEAFIRSFDGTGSDLSPWNLFAHAATDSVLIELDRLCRTLHVLNYFGRFEPASALFLNVHDRLMLAVGDDHGRAFGRVLSALEIERRRVVIESPEAMADDLSMLSYVMLNYRYNGYRIGVNLSRGEQLERLFDQLRPDYVKLDAGRDDTARRLPDFARKCERYGVQLIVKRIGTAGALEQVRGAGVTLGQGHALARPSGPDGSA